MNLGVYTRAELVARGETDSSLRRSVRDQTLTRIRDGWYATTDANPAAIEAVRRGGVLSCVSALDLHGFWVAPGYPGVHFRGTRTTKRQGACGHHGRLRPAGGAIDSPALALACAAKCMRAEDWIAVVDSVLNTKQMAVEDMRQALDGLIDHEANRLLEKCDPDAESGTESIVRVRLRAHNFKVVVQPRITGVGRYDLGVGRLLIECDSKTHHMSERDYERDRWRDRKVMLAGYLPLRLTYSTVFYDWEDAMADIVALTRKARHRYGAQRC